MLGSQNLRQPPLQVSNLKGFLARLPQGRAPDHKGIATFPGSGAAILASYSAFSRRKRAQTSVLAASNRLHPPIAPRQLLGNRHLIRPPATDRRPPQAAAVTPSPYISSSLFSYSHDSALHLLALAWLSIPSAHRAWPRRMCLPHHQHLRERGFDLIDEALMKGSDRVVVGVLVPGDEAKATRS